MIKIRARVSDRVRFAGKGCTVKIKDGDETILEEEIKEDMTITEYGIFEFKNEFGCKKGIGGYFGEKGD